MKKNIRKLSILGGLSLTLALNTGCSLFIEDMYSAVTPYTVSPISEGSGVIAIENYRELVNALLHFVSGHEVSGQIRLNNYQREDARMDLAEAVEEVLSQTAMGSYAVNGIDWEIQSIMSNLEAEITLDYRKSQEEYRAIIPVNGSEAIVRHIGESFADYRESLVVQNVWSSSDRTQISQLIQRGVERSLDYLVEMPEIHVTFYPKEGPWWIMELDFHYDQSKVVLQQQQEELAEVMSKGNVWSSGEGDIHQVLLRDLRETAEVATVGTTPYDVLLEGRGDDVGFALTYYALCMDLYLDCTLVAGTLLSEAHMWNQITLQNGDIHFVDATVPLTEAGRVPYYSSEEMLAMGYDWAEGDYPQAVPYEEEIVLEEEEEE